MSTDDDDDYDDYDDDDDGDGDEDEDEDEQEEREVSYTDILRARERHEPQFASLVIRYVDQSDPPENAPEEPVVVAHSEGAEGESKEARKPPPLPKDAWTLARLRQALSPASLWGKTAREKESLRREAWNALMAASYPPPRLRLGDLLVDLHETGDEWSRAQLVEIIRKANIGWGLWRGVKHIYKLVEERHDPELFGILAWRFDAMSHTETVSGEVSSATFGYMRRRAWRYLRQLGQALPELYPQFAVQVLRHYPAHSWFRDSWIASQIWAHKDLIGARSAWHSEPPAKLDRRAFDDAWKISPEPLLRLLEDAQNDSVCSFAIRGLKADFPASLREVDPRWLARIGKKPLASVHTFVVELLEGSPEFHRSKLADLGLHDMVVSLLASESDKASAYAVEYAKSHAPDIPIDDLIAIAEDGTKVARDFVMARLAKKSPAQLGMNALVRMLATSSLVKLAREKWNDGYKPRDLTAAIYVALANGDSDQQEFVRSFYKQHKEKVPAAFLRAQVEDPDMSRWQRRRVMEELGKRKAAEIGIGWIKEALLDKRFTDSVTQWLRQGILSGDELDVEWLQGLTMRASTRALAVELLGNRKLVPAGRIGLPWLLAMVRQADETLSQFAHNYLLEHFDPGDFASDGSGDKQAGTARLWQLVDATQPEAVRRFAATYLEVHHPDLNTTSAEARQLGIKPRLAHGAYSLDRVRPCFFDPSAEVRRLARHIGRHELVRWGDRKLVYELCGSRYREGRALAAEALLHIGDSDADPRLVPPIDWLVPAQVFALAESPSKATREVALTLVRRHYDRLGGVHKLGWLMESPDREVRLFAVRLLWDKHRPVDHPHAAAGGEPGSDTERDRFESLEALQSFLRTVLFGLPPGRMERRESTGDALPDRPLPASVAKMRLIEVVRDLALENGWFAQVAAPVLEEFVHSQAKGEWQGCVTALARIRRAHPNLTSLLPPALPFPSPGKSGHGGETARSRPGDTRTIETPG